MSVVKLPRALNGKTLQCKYPLDGTRNILCLHVGRIIKHARNKENGRPYITIRQADGSFRTLRRDRMIDAEIVEVS